MTKFVNPCVFKLCSATIFSFLTALALMKVIVCVVFSVAGIAEWCEMKITGSCFDL